VFLSLLCSGCGSQPVDLGVNAGQLKACPNSPNCVHSQQDPGSDHYIPPLSYTDTQAQALARLSTLLRDTPKTHIVTENEDYLWVEFKSQWLGFVDDVEFWFAPPTEAAEHYIHVRSASRLGHHDFGANRKRIEAIRSAF